MSRTIIEIANDVVSFDWSDNDPDAARYIDELREAVEKIKAVERIRDKVEDI